MTDWNTANNLGKTDANSGKPAAPTHNADAALADAYRQSYLQEQARLEQQRRENGG